MVIFIIGMPGSGKTVVGKKLSKALNLPFIDTDEEFKKLIQVNPSEFRNLFDEKEDWFRRLEERIISTISKEKSVVVATGGGAVLSEKNRKIFHENYTFFLDCDRDIIKERLKDRTILPDRGFKEVSQLWKERKQYYKEFENLILDADKYPILIGEGLLSLINNVKNMTHFVSDFFKDKNLKLNGEKTYVKSGEGLKTLDNLKEYYKKLIDLERDRYSPICSVGGGSMGDFFGMLSGTFMRGIPFYMVPTTFLSMVDSSVGGKVGVNFEKIKNAVGMTNDPQLVIIDTDFLKTLSTREFNSGMFEVLKCGFLRDKKLLNNGLSTSELILRSLKVKLHFVEIDYKDFGDRRFLNFGHTIGHAIELLTNIKHGEAVGYGMLCEIHLSYLNGLLDKEKFEQCISKIDLNILPKINVDSEEVIKMMSHDKKKIGNSINFTLLKDMSQPVIYNGIDELQIKKVIEEYVN